MVMKLKALKKYPSRTLLVFLGGLLTVTGLFILLFPGASLKTVCLCIGALALITGAMRVFEYYKDRKSGKQSFWDIFSGILLLTISLILIFRPAFLLSVIPFFMGLSIATYGISSFFSIHKIGKGLFSRLSSIALTVFGIFLIFNPFKGATTITAFVGFGLLIFGAALLLYQIFGKDSTSLPKTDGNGYTEVEFKDVD